MQNKKKKSNRFLKHFLKNKYTLCNYKSFNTKQKSKSTNLTSYTQIKSSNNKQKVSSNPSTCYKLIKTPIKPLIKPIYYTIIQILIKEEKKKSPSNHSTSLSLSLSLEIPSQSSLSYLINKNIYKTTNKNANKTP